MTVGAGILDTCCLINLFASGKGSDILQATQHKWYVPAVVMGESLFLRGEDSQGQATREPLDLASIVSSGVIEIAEARNEAENDLFVTLAQSLDDGEAMALAIAGFRSWVLATDDRRARNCASRLDVQVITTPEMISLWYERAGASKEAVAELIARIERLARFFPAKDAPLAEWWGKLRRMAL
jgi:predicted nucleic acid-binding protein